MSTLPVSVLVFVSVNTGIGVSINIIKYLGPCLGTSRVKKGLFPSPSLFLSLKFLLLFWRKIDKYLLRNILWSQMNCHCRVLTLMYRDFWLRRTLNSRFILGEYGGAPDGEETLF